MADVENTSKITSPYDHPRPPLSDPILRFRETTENQAEDETSENPDTTIEINEEINKGNINELPENAEEKEDGEKEDGEKEDEEKKKDTKKPLLEEEDESVKIQIEPDDEGEDTPTLPLPDKKKKSKEALEDIVKKPERKLPKYLFPITRLKNAWSDSSNVFQFSYNATCIIFQTVGWFTCVGGIPFLSLVMLIIGSIYIDNCNVQPKIPIYLIVSGVIGTIQHFLTIWIKYVPKESQGRLKVYKSYFRAVNGLFHIFLLIWFILGSVWVYGSFSEVEYVGPEKDEYCHRTLYHFAFWIFNLSYILLGLIIFLSMCFLICHIATDN